MLVCTTCPPAYFALAWDQAGTFSSLIDRSVINTESHRVYDVGESFPAIPDPKIRWFLQRLSRAIVKVLAGDARVGGGMYCEGNYKNRHMTV